ncbi:Protein SCAR3 [Zea mays]|uniref:Protein SCAR3 n=1 Tax=Zea mays TaxID=4577 RepID=A0A1D6FGM1_MAIZE|nr:Protein SCAR3 [Zea mays]AQK90994.1 Protein SCAR3 [Zea mays]
MAIDQLILEVRKLITSFIVSDRCIKFMIILSISPNELSQSEQLKLNGHERSKKAVGGDIKSLDEREELLQQIRSKTFNLRRTNASKADGSSQSTASSNVAAILEKANAIRQAVASDEGGDDDTWSDI